MRALDHRRTAGYLAAMHAIHQSAADDLEAQRGDIRPARVKYAYRDAMLHSVSARVIAAVVSPFRKRA